MTSAKRIRLFMSSPGDVGSERQDVLTVVDELNRTLGRHLNLVVEALDWSRDVHPAAGRPQGVINEQIGRYDIFVGIMWRRFGTPSVVAGSGTEEEFLLAYESWSTTGLPHILFYFCEAPAPPPSSRSEVEQLAKVVEFRERLWHEYPQLVATYDDRAMFAATLREDLHNLLLRHFAGQLPLSDGLAAVLEIHKQACQRRGVSFLTPNMLLALLSRPDGLTRRSLDDLRPGLAVELDERLQRYDADRTVEEAGGFVPFDWDDREDVRRASSLARADGRSRIDEKHLLLGVLAGTGATVTELEGWLGSTEFTSLIETIREAEEAPPQPLHTPGFSLAPESREPGDPR